MAPVKKMAILRISPAMLRELLQLPEEAELVSVCIPEGRRGVLSLTVKGIGWDTPEGSPIMAAPIPQISDFVAAPPAVLRHRSIDWGLPQESAAPKYEFVTYGTARTAATEGDLYESFTGRRSAVLDAGEGRG